MDKFRNKYRISSARLQNWHYGWNARYFVTICTANRKLFFGDIQNDIMALSDIGTKADEYWLEIPKHFPFVKLDVHVVMPNHIHGIIKIDKPDDGRNNEKNDKRMTERNLGCNDERNVERDAGRSVETQNFASLPSSSQPQQPKNQFGPQSQNLASVIRGYKTGVTKYARNNNIVFAWQSRFHDHIIRDNDSYRRIKNYIINNPKHWNNDSLNT